jgi:hypothetical protein
VIRAYVHDNYMSYNVGISILNEQPSDDGGAPFRRLLRFNGDDMLRTWEEIDYNQPMLPTLTLGHDEAMALVAALTNHYQGVDNERLLRKDYDAERGRVDKLADAVIEIARGGAGRD